MPVTVALLVSQFFIGQPDKTKTLADQKNQRRCSHGITLTKKTTSAQRLYGTSFLNALQISTAEYRTIY